MSEIRQIVILAGGKGTGMKEMTENLPKPMVPICGIPVLDHIINIFDSQRDFEYIICSGYLGKKLRIITKIKKYKSCIYWK